MEWLRLLSLQVLQSMYPSGRSACTLCSVANAHGLYLSSEGGKLHANFSDHSPASGAVVTVVDEDGIVIVRDTMDEKGIWTLHLRNLAGGIGCLLVSSFEQAENVERAMQSRGFSGMFPLLVEDNDAVTVPYCSLIFLLVFACIVWFGVFCDVLCYPCPEFIL